MFSLGVEHLVADARREVVNVLLDSLAVSQAYLYHCGAVVQSAKPSRTTTKMNGMMKTKQTTTY